MARLGEQLAAAGVVSTDKVEQALRAQVVWGARLGTNLIELGCIDLDELSRMLGQQRGVPAALARHFDKSDPDLQAQLPVEIAKQFCVVPLVRLSPERIAVVAVDPLPPAALVALANVYGVNALTGVVTSVAAEMRVLYHLERVYKIPRATRYLRSKNASRTMEFPAFDNVPVEIDIDTDLAVPIEIDQSSFPTGRAERSSIPPGLGSADDVALMIDIAIDAATTPSVDESEPKGRERRTYVRTLADQVEPITGEEKTAPIVSRTLTPNRDATAGALGRIAIRRLAVPAAAVNAATTPPLTGGRVGGATSLSDAMRAIRRGPNRDRVADLVIETLEQFVTDCEAALLLVIRGDIAIGWKHFSRSMAGTTEIAVPLDQSGLVPTVIARNQSARCDVTDLGTIDRALLRALGTDEGDLAIVPIAIGDQVMCLLATATDPSAEIDGIESIAAAAGAAFVRLIRDASR